MLAIPPFNYPVNLAVSKIGPALMAGNTIVLKPPTQGAAAGVMMVQVCTLPLLCHFLAAFWAFCLCAGADVLRGPGLCWRRGQAR